MISEVSKEEKGAAEPRSVQGGKSEQGQWRIIEVQVDEEIPFSVAMKIAKAIAEYFNSEIKAWWDCDDGEHSPDLGDVEYSDSLDELAQAWDKKLQEYKVHTEVIINSDYHFYISGD